MKKTYTKKYKSDPEVLPDVEQYILETIERNIHLSEEKKNSIELASAEAAANCVLHGNKGNSKKILTVKILLNNEKIILSLKDEGDGFKPEEVPDPTMPENILKGSGRGLHIMRSLVDDMSFNFTSGGTEIILSFNL